MDPEIGQVLSYWFGDAREDAGVLQQKGSLWFQRSDATDSHIRDHFGGLHAAASAGEKDDWAATSRGRLALIIVLDQFSRNLYRGQPESFASDSKALSLSLEGLAQSVDKSLRPVERVFFYMPLEHSEALDMQERCVELFEELQEEVPADLAQSFASFADYARRHRDVIAQWGRFPHRNTILNRSSTPEELEFLKQPGSSF